MKLYCYKKWTTCKKVVKWLDAKKVEYEYIEIYETPPSKEDFQIFFENNDYKLKKYFNTSGVRYRELGMKDKFDSLSEEEAFDMLSKDGKLVKRPLLVKDNIVLIGFKEEIWDEFIAK